MTRRVDGIIPVMLTPFTDAGAISTRCCRHCRLRRLSGFTSAVIEYGVRERFWAIDAGTVRVRSA